MAFSFGFPEAPGALEVSSRMTSERREPDAASALESSDRIEVIVQLASLGTTTAESSSHSDFMMRNPPIVLSYISAIVRQPMERPRIKLALIIRQASSMCSAVPSGAI